MEYSFLGGRNLNDYGVAITRSQFAGYDEENNLPKDMIQKMPLLFQLKKFSNTI